MSLKAWFLSWFPGAPIDAAPAAPELYKAGPLVIERAGEGYAVRQDGGGGKWTCWWFASAEDMRKQLAEFGGASTAPELLAALQATAPEALEPIASDPLVVGS